MKKLLLLLALTPFTAQAATLVTCDSIGAQGDLKFTLDSREGILNTDSKLKISAQGVLLTEFNTAVEQTDLGNAQKVVVKIKSLLPDGSIDPQGVEATIQLAAAKGPYRSIVAAGTGAIDITKKPPPRFNRPIIDQYVLSNCVGIIQD